MSRGYSCTPLWALSRNSALDGNFFVKISQLDIVPISLALNSVTKIVKTQCEKFSGLHDYI